MVGSPNRCAGISKSVVYLTAVAAVSVRINEGSEYETKIGACEVGSYDPISKVTSLWVSYSLL
jgi:hypothetical protein